MLRLQISDLEFELLNFSRSSGCGQVVRRSGGQGVRTVRVSSNLHHIAGIDFAGHRLLDQINGQNKAVGTLFLD